jgi:hypothetical protein
MLLAIAVFLLGFSAIPLVSHAGLVVLFSRSLTAPTRYFRPF